MVLGRRPPSVGGGRDAEGGGRCPDTVTVRAVRVRDTPDTDEEPAFCDEDGMPVVTACMWRQAGDDRWQAGTIVFPEDATEDPDGAAYLFQLLVDRSPEAFQRWAEDYYEIPVDLAAVRHVFSSRPLTEEVVRSLNSDIGMADLSGDIAEIGYPTR